MATFVSLINWTDQGIKTFSETVDRAEDAARLAEKLGGKLTHTWWTVGPHDIVAVFEFPDDESGTAFLLRLGALGNIRTTTLRGFSADEMRSIIAKAS